MLETSFSLLDRLHQQPDDEAWRRLVDVYTPLIHGWLHRQSVQHDDRDDVVQEVMTVVIRRLPEFEHNRRIGAFRAWLRTITVNCLRDFWRSKRIRPVAAGDSSFVNVLDQLADPNSGMSRIWDEEHDRHVMKRLKELLQPQFEKKTWQAFQRLTVDGMSPDVVAKELGITVNAVFIAKSRVLARLRQEAAGLVE
jgi:RNA polymerase sigma-70 factor (ECF subfamily)